MNNDDLPYESYQQILKKLDRLIDQINLFSDEDILKLIRSKRQTLFEQRRATTRRVVAVAGVLLLLCVAALLMAPPHKWLSIAIIIVGSCALIVTLCGLYHLLLFAIIHHNRFRPIIVERYAKRLNRLTNFYWGCFARLLPPPHPRPSTPQAIPHNPSLSQFPLWLRISSTSLCLALATLCCISITQQREQPLLAYQSATSQHPQAYSLQPTPPYTPTQALPHTPTLPHDTISPASTTYTTAENNVSTTLPIFDSDFDSAIETHPQYGELICNNSCDIEQILEDIEYFRNALI